MITQTRFFVTCIAIALMSVGNSVIAAEPAKPALEIKQPAPAKTPPAATASAPKDKTQAVSDDDINRFTNTIVLIKDF